MTDADRANPPIENYIVPVRRWVERLVVEKNLCPFAGRELENNRVRFAVTEADTEELLLAALQAELKRLIAEPELETTLLIHPHTLSDFLDYNDFLNTADDLIQQMQLQGIFQVASFHPRYQFAGTQPEAAENYTNRSPYPLLHILREESLEGAIASYPDVQGIPTRNIELMNVLGAEALGSLLKHCFTSATEQENDG